MSSSTFVLFFKFNKNRSFVSVCTFCWEFSYDKGSKYIGFERLPIRCKMLLANVGFLESSVEKMIFWWFSSC